MNEKSIARRRSIRGGHRFTAGTSVVLAFLIGIAVGTILLTLPASHTGAVSVTPYDALFTATSAICVTGLSVADTGTAYSGFGQAVILTLIQIGGLGAAVLGVGLMQLRSRGLTLRDRTLLLESWNLGSYRGTGTILRRVLLLTVGMEACGAVLAIWIFSGTMPFGKAVWTGVFHAVSSFNNAGFDILGNGDSLAAYADHAALNLLTSALVVLGGIGYLVLFDLFSAKHSKLRLHTKIVLTMTAALLIFGTVILRLTERITWQEALFQSMSARTAGFATVDMRTFSTGGKLLYCVMMFIGASPCSTGGGIKTTTVFAVFLSMRSAVTGREKQTFRRTVPDEVTRKAHLVLAVGAGTILCGILALSFFEPERDLMDLTFEAVSAFATVGVSLNVTPTLSAGGRAVIILLMYLGRLGPMTVAAVCAQKKEPAFRYSEESFTIG